MSGGAPTSPGPLPPGVDRAAIGAPRMIVLGVLAVLILIAAIVISQSGSDDGDASARAGRAADRAVEEARGHPQDGVFLGEDGAPIVTEFVDLQCPFCAEFSNNAFNDLVEDNVRPGDILHELRVISFLGEDSARRPRWRPRRPCRTSSTSSSRPSTRTRARRSSRDVTEEFLREIGEKTPGLDVEQALEPRPRPRPRR